jgi:hypothetical protein
VEPLGIAALLAYTAKEGIGPEADGPSAGPAASFLSAASFAAASSATCFFHDFLIRGLLCHRLIALGLLVSHGHSGCRHINHDVVGTIGPAVCSSCQWSPAYRGWHMAKQPKPFLQGEVLIG